MDADLQKKFAMFVRNFVFGVEDSLVSTAGLLSGIAVANVPRETILLAGIVLIFVEAFSMAVGSFLSESSAEKYLAKHEVVSRTSVLSAGVMFFSYFFSGFLPLAPYLFLPVEIAFWCSMVVSLIALFVLGVVGAKISQTSLLRGGIKMCMIGGIALLLGVLVGTFFNGSAT
jgi:VIT1/CCC1 family predicted Fe2+/Mn2+ transporter